MIESTRAWKDPKFRSTLTPEELAALPANPAGETWRAMDNDELLQLVGGVAVPVTVNSGGYVCTLTTECPIWSFCCSQSSL